MSDKQPSKPDEEVQVTCNVCMKELPLSAAMTDEASDYVYYFCGPDCYAKWRSKEDADK